MEILPIEAKWHICRSVKANPFVKFGDSVTLQKAVFELKEGRRGRLFLKHARRLDIVCLWNYSEKPWHQSNMIYRSMEIVHYGLPASENTFLKYCLKDELNFVVKNMYPPSLHQVLRQYHPECRLNIWTFQGVNLDTPILPRIQRPRAYENLGILSGRPWINSDGILPIVCMTPSLKHLNIRGRSSHSVTLLKSLGKEYTATVKHGLAACLVSLSFTSPARCGAWEKTLLEMASYVDLSRLRSLDISIHSDPTLLMRAASILTSLERLFLTMDPWMVVHPIQLSASRQSRYH
ncbi:hypothetical protein BDV34DRAFT_215869 [Aspergillus parasiticus]|uniref:Uncharacterized protein n=1 Tax=Aspergillus parasiticus TaxID=5067 RepID=A0A5N6DAF5_ASPPA|nr:hypothetical protein BDV34DRAFT_215869 [Aspergillus parasiticus]